ncbi:glycosyltransferase [Streptomyces echinoruber]|uniref:Hyaluronan synthase n=1 Tax=Streptomyces echinoruber TaxID=68898 RepID=A0A918QZ07_9ACTN|nr:glycosyltransferase [Streptomyces echinoruber]GGZ80385.1 hyaluronan synthase [Streptomyces echinoruber]
MYAHLSTYGIAVGSVLLAKLLLSVRRTRRGRRTAWRPGPPFTIAAVITVYNEAPEMLRRCLVSLLQQTRQPQMVTVVDDASRDMSAAAVVRDLHRVFTAAGIELRFIRFPVNRGKRHGLAAGFTQAPDADLYLCVDSDTVLDEHAVDEAVRPFSKRRVNAVTGLVLAHNRARNLLTRLIDMRYVNAFLGERVAYGRLGSVLCACGSLALYRGWVVRKYLDDFLNQTFLGRPATFGDDRRLTFYCLLEGLSVIQPTALAWTDVPERLGHYTRQQIRWGKSFIRESLLMLGTWRILRVCWWLSLLELIMWATFTAALIAALVAAAVHPAGPAILAGYLAYACAMAWLRSLHYLRAAARVPLADRVMTFAAAPLYALLNLGLLLPLRLWSLATLRDNAWGTRHKGAEITTGTPAALIPHPTTHDEHDTVPIRTVTHQT